MKKQLIIIAPFILSCFYIFFLCLIISCNKKEPVEETKLILNDHVITYGTLWFLTRILETGFDEISEDFDSTLNIAVRLTDTTLSILKDDSIVLASSYYQEFHKYIADDDSCDFIVKYDPSSQRMPEHPKTGRDMIITERKDVFCYAADDLDGLMKKGYYHNVFGMLLFNKQGEMATQVEVGDTVYALNTSMLGPCVVTEPKKKSPITADSKALEFSISDLELLPVSLYDFLDYHLKRINVVNVFLNREKSTEKEVPRYHVTLTASQNVTKEVEKQIIHCLKNKDFLKYFLTGN